MFIMLFILLKRSPWSDIYIIFEGYKMKKRSLIVSVVMMTLITMIPCFTAPSVKIDASWVRPDYKAKKFNKIIVIAVFKVITTRQYAERKISELLKKNGVDAIMGINVITPGEDKPSKEAFVKKMKALNVDGAIIVNLVDVKKENPQAKKENQKTSVEHYDNLSWNYGYFGNWGYPGYVGGHGYYGPGYHGGYYASYTVSNYNISYDPNWTDTTKKVVLAMHFYEIGKDKLVWVTQSSNAHVDQANIEYYINAYANALVDKMIGMKLVEK